MILFIVILLVPGGVAAIGEIIVSVPAGEITSAVNAYNRAVDILTALWVPRIMRATFWKEESWLS